MYGSFGGKMDWARCHFEIKPPDYITGMRHFLVGDENDKGVMRNFLVVTDENGEFLLQEEDPDQWLMLRNLVLLRDCVTGEVVVFTRSPQMTKTGDIVLALQDLGEEMIGKMLCDEDEEWVDEIM
ncbi:uncharacterized protein LOC125234926 [Leguminivora glycinivorella]|uniref:uncharacterized protein LOC125234926 n=1 Tax=Leguminivora glycinivorella TaxID=1035111 RepID=UPI00200EAC46|nr:uncharacterized protein LOC125234926 [Leguminivora glycinivorella]